ncbi:MULTISPECIES: SDR family oxidoreductase [unclassified Variovorax]|jgi:3-oxoacyl-[acyl-carrier protein] reductase|uniref:SDR family NAD(P)-dependent oxidoreductase n=1 Tax=unclassified Variovorax TaxID=663243 RepID=UPI002576E20B|nr:MULTISPECIES: SDR family oxidoreductase [unclassified Variovorax]MDM0089911.1 SDR family oxidoreductase [Variovorax sp. J22G40]MDM0148423.1 SDR family oxidoreductase [Variovorax sp. J2P1-31]
MTPQQATLTTLVTGGASGIGAAIVRACAARGDNVVFTYWSSEEEAKALAAEFGDRVLALRSDVTDEQQVDAAFEAAIGRFGRVDVLVANAGGLLQRVKCADTTLAFWRQAMDLNLTSAFLCCRAALRHMTPRRTGNIVIMASLAGHDGGGPAATHYGAAKGALLAYARGLAKEVGPDGIRVNAIAPGLIATRFHDVFNTPQGRAAGVERTPLRREGQPEDVAKAALFLSSDDSSFITGEVMEINGGMALF